jgi:hypothetical protein
LFWAIAARLIPGELGVRPNSRLALSALKKRNVRAAVDVTVHPSPIEHDPNVDMAVPYVEVSDRAFGPSTPTRVLSARSRSMHNIGWFSPPYTARILSIGRHRAASRITAASKMKAADALPDRRTALLASRGVTMVWTAVFGVS